MDERCPPAEYDRLLSWVRRRYYGAWALFLVGGLLLVDAWVRWGFRGIPVYGTPFAALAVGSVLGASLQVAGLALYARSKGLSWAWGLMGLGCVFGWAVLLGMPKRCRYCGRAPAGRGLDCRYCGGPI